MASRLAKVAVGVVVALFATSGVAYAVTGDPWAPVTEIAQLFQSDEGAVDDADEGAVDEGATSDIDKGNVGG